MFKSFMCLCLLVNVFVSQEQKSMRPTEIRLNGKYVGNRKTISDFKESKEPQATNSLIVLDQIAVSDSRIDLFGAKVRSTLRKQLPKNDDLKSCESVDRYEVLLGNPLLLPFESFEMFVDDGNTTIYSTREWEACCIQADGTIRYVNVFVYLSEFYAGRNFLSLRDAENVKPSKTTIEDRLITEAILKPDSQSQIAVDAKSNSPLRKFIAKNKNLIGHERRILQVVNGKTMDRTPERKFRKKPIRKKPPKTNDGD